MHYMDNQSRAVLIGERIFNETELACRLEVELEKYNASGPPEHGRCWLVRGGLLPVSTLLSSRHPQNRCV